MPITRRGFSISLLLLALFFSGCKKKSDTPDVNVAGKVYLVPIGDAPQSEISDLVPYFKQKFGLDSEILPPMKPGPSDIDNARQQLIAEDLVQSLVQNYPQQAQDKTSVLIGITGQDLYPKSQNWQFCFGWRVGDMRAAVASTARMDVHYPGEPDSEATVSKRLRKVVNKDVGILYYNKQQSNNPKSVLYNNVGGIQELDQVGEDF